MSTRAVTTLPISVMANSNIIILFVKCGMAHIHINYDIAGCKHVHSQLRSLYKVSMLTLRCYVVNKIFRHWLNLEARLMYLLFWIELNRSAGVKGLSFTLVCIL